MVVCWLRFAFPHRRLSFAKPVLFTWTTIHLIRYRSKWHSVIKLIFTFSQEHIATQQEGRKKKERLQIIDSAMSLVVCEPTINWLLWARARDKDRITRTTEYEHCVTTSHFHLIWVWHELKITNTSWADTSYALCFFFYCKTFALNLCPNLAKIVQIKEQHNSNLSSIFSSITTFWLD